MRPSPRPPSPPPTTARQRTGNANAVGQSNNSNYITVRWSKGQQKVAVITLVSSLTALLFLGLSSTGSASELSSQERLPLFLINLMGFVGPTLVAGILPDSVAAYENDPSTCMGYWVLLAMSATLDRCLPPVTPFYSYTKGAILLWGACPDHLFGGRFVLGNMYDAIHDHDNWPVPSRALAYLETSVAEIRAISRRAFRLLLALLSLALVNIAVGIGTWLILVVEAAFSGQVRRLVQADVCILVGAAWPMYATLKAQARAKKASTGGSRASHGARASPRNRVRQGPAAVQWLSYWPMYAFLHIALDPLLGWIPHFYSVKLVVLVLLASPQTRMACIATSLLSTFRGSRARSSDDNSGTSSLDNFDFDSVSVMNINSSRAMRRPGVNHIPRSG